MADDAALFYFDTNIEDVVQRVTTGVREYIAVLKQQGRVGGLDQGEVRGVEQSIARVINTAKQGIAQINTAIAGGAQINLTKGLQSEVSRARQIISSELAGRGLSIDVALDITNNALAPLLKDAKAQVAAARRDTRPNVQSNIGSGRIEQRSTDFNTGFSNPQLARIERRRLQVAERSAAVAEAQAKAAGETTGLVTQGARARRREARALEQTANAAQSTATSAQQTATAAAAGAQAQKTTTANQQKEAKASASGPAAAGSGGGGRGPTGPPAPAAGASGPSGPREPFGPRTPPQTSGGQLGPNTNVITHLQEQRLIHPGFASIADAKSILNKAGDDYEKGIVKLANGLFADTRGGLTTILRKAGTGYRVVGDKSTDYVQALIKLADTLDGNARKAALARAEFAQQSIETQHQGNLTNRNGDFHEGVETIGGPGGNVVADTRGIQAQIFKRTENGFRELLRGSSEFEAEIRKLRAQQHGKNQGGIFGNFAQGLTQGSFFNNSNGKAPTFQGALEGLSRSAGTTFKYALLGQGLFALQTAAAAMGAEFLDAADSVTELNLALSNTDAGKAAGGFTADQQTINDLSNSAVLAGANVGQSMDLAASAIRGFGDQAKGSKGEIEQLGVSFANEASKIAVLTKTDIADAAGNLKATALAFDVPVTGLSRVTDALVGAKAAGGGNEKDIGQGVASAAIAAKEAGFSLEETAALISKIVAETDESGQAAATRFSKITSILGGSAGKTALIRLNETLNPSQKIDITSSVKEQVQQLSSIYGDLSETQRQLLVNSLGGNAQARELIILLQNANSLIATADKGFTGQGEKEFQKRLNDIRGVLTQITGEVKQIVVGLANTGVLDPLVFAVKEGLLPALEVTRQLLNIFQLIPRPIRSIAFAIGEVLLALKAVQAIGRTTGLKTFLGGIASSLSPLKGAGGAGGAAGAAGAAGGARVAAVQAAQARTTAAAAGTAAGAAAGARSSIIFGRLPGLATGVKAAGQTVGDAFGTVKLRKTADLAATANLGTAKAAQRAQRQLDALFGSKSSAVGRLQDSFIRLRFNAEALANTYGLGKGANLPVRASETAEETAAAERAAATGKGAKAGLGAAAAAAGPELAVVGGIIAAQAAYDANRKIDESLVEFGKLRNLNPASFGVDDLRDSAANLKTGAHDLNQASSGLFGTIVNALQGNPTGDASKVLTAQADFQTKQADRIDAAQKAARASSDTSDLSDTIDLTTGDALKTSLDALSGSGADATIQFKALIGAMDGLANSSGGLSTDLTALQKIKISSGAGVQFGKDLANVQADNSVGLSYQGRTKGNSKIAGVNDFLFGILTGGQGANLAQNNSGILGKAARRVFAGADTQNTEKNFNLSKVDVAKSQQAITDISQKYFDTPGNGGASDAGEKELEALYQDYFTKNYPKLTKSQIDDLAHRAGLAVQKSAKALTSINDPTATLVEILSQGADLAATAASEAGVQAALGKGGKKNVSDGSALAEANTNLADLKKARQRAIELGATSADLKSYDQKIASATVAQRDAAASRQSSRDALALSKIPEQSTSARSQAGLDAINKKLSDAGYDPATGKRKFTTQKSFVNVPGREGHVREVDQRVAVGSGLDANDLDDTLAARNAAIREQKQNDLADKQARARAKIDPSDEKKNAARDLTDAKQNLQLLKDEGATGAERARAKLAVEVARQNSVKADAAYSIAARNVNALPDSTLDTAKRNLADATTTLNAMTKGTTAYNQQLAVKNQAAEALAKASADVRSIKRQLNLDLTDPVQVANEDVKTARQALARARRQAAKSDDPNVRAELIGTAEINLRSKLAAAESAAFSQFLTNVNNAKDLGNLSSQQYIGLLKGREDQLRAQLAQLKKGDPLFQLYNDELTQLLLAEKSAADTLTGQFNIGDIKVPTPYEVRRALTAKNNGQVLDSNSSFSTAGNVTNDTSTKNVILNGVPIQEVLSIIEDLFGKKARSRANRKV